MVVRPIVAHRASEKDNSIHRPCILAPTTFSYILNAGVQLRANEIERAKRAHNSLLVCCNALLYRLDGNFEQIGKSHSGS